MIAHSQQYPEDPSDVGREWVSVFSGLFPATLSPEALQPLPIHKPWQYKCYTKPGLLAFLALWKYISSAFRDVIWDSLCCICGYMQNLGVLICNFLWSLHLIAATAVCSCLPCLIPEDSTVLRLWIHNVIELEYLLRQKASKSPETEGKKTVIWLWH